MIVTIILVIVTAFRLAFIGFYFDNIFQFLVGFFKYPIYLFTIYFLILQIFDLKIKLSFSHILAIILLSLASLLFICELEFLLHPSHSVDNYLSKSLNIILDGKFDTWFISLIPLLLYNLLYFLIGKIGIIICNLIAITVAIFLIFGSQKVFKFGKKVQEKTVSQVKKINASKTKGFKVPTIKRDLAVEVSNKQQKPVENKPSSISKHQEVNIGDNKANYNLPSYNLLSDSNNSSLIKRENELVARNNAKKIIELLNQFNIKVSISHIAIGPSVTRFELVPDKGTRINKIVALQDEIMMNLAAKYLRIEAPIPGKSAVGIEVENYKKELVTMKEGMINLKNASPLTLVLGKNLIGEYVYAKLNKMPHLLIAGATGSGKSVCVNTIIVSILMNADYRQVKLLLIDPKKVEFSAFSNIPHLLSPIINDAKTAANALIRVTNIMDQRYDLFAMHKVKNIADYLKLRETNHELADMPYIVVIIDELADLMMVASKEVEAAIQRITQLARAAGIHLIVATQRPSVDVITGVIKSNIPSRIAFAVSSATDSRTILDSNGAEELLGNGDMLYIPIGENKATRIQGVYISDGDIEKICNYCSSQVNDVDYQLDLSVIEEQTTSEESNSDLDSLYNEVKQFVIESQKISVSLIQRRFSIGYNRAMRIVEQLEENGVVSAPDKSRNREVLINR